MRILKEEYTREEIQDRIIDTRNIISALIDSLYILQSVLEESKADDESYENLARYTGTYVRNIEEMSTDFYDDFEDLLEEKDIEDEVDDYEYDSEIEESLKTNGSVNDFFNDMQGKTKREAEKIVAKAKGNPNAVEAYKHYLETLKEDTEKNSKGKWVNKGKEGTHGEFKTKKEADAQRKAMFANGYKG